MGTGYNATLHAVDHPTTSFQAGQTAYLVFTVDTTAAHAVAEVKILRGSTVEDVSLPISLSKGSHAYEKAITLGAAGTVTIEVSYNGQVQASTQVNAG
jgi:hypothetical protein